MLLHSYGEGELAIVSQVWCGICRGDTTPQVQKKAPVDALLGTDTLHKLGITLIQTENATGPTDLLQPAERDLPTVLPDPRAPSPDPHVQGKEEISAPEH